ncbi:MAG: hypothetical protein LBJ63_11455 [Prevotellaceae bacterium]|jgi:hypothetical protein|nr:hypothetical protein [Prevotellaceae bacterium]
MSINKKSFWYELIDKAIKDDKMGVDYGFSIPFLVGVYNKMKNNTIDLNSSECIRALLQNIVDTEDIPVYLYYCTTVEACIIAYEGIEPLENPICLGNLSIERKLVCKSKKYDIVHISDFLYEKYGNGIHKENIIAKKFSIHKGDKANGYKKFGKYSEYEKEFIKKCIEEYE